MTWKSTVFVSGAGVLATWLAGAQSPALIPPQAAAVAPSVPSSTAAPSSSGAPEIAELADRLGQRNQSADDFDRPARNLFRFAPRALARRAESPQPVAPPAVSTLPAPVLIHLSGVAMDRVGDMDVWTAILSTPAGVVLAREGDEAAPGIRVAAIGAESVSLTYADGSTSSLPLSGR